MIKAKFLTALLICGAGLFSPLASAVELSEYALGKLAAYAAGDQKLLNAVFEEYHNPRASVVKLSGDKTFEFQFAAVPIAPEEGVEAIALWVYFVRVKITAPKSKLAIWKKGQSSEVVMLAPSDVPGEESVLDGLAKNWEMKCSVDRSVYMAVDFSTLTYLVDGKEVNFEDVTFTDNMFLSRAEPIE